MDRNISSQDVVQQFGDLPPVRSNTNIVVGPVIGGQVISRYLLKWSTMSEIITSVEVAQHSLKRFTRFASQKGMDYTCWPTEDSEHEL